LDRSAVSVSNVARSRPRVKRRAALGLIAIAVGCIAYQPLHNWNSDPQSGADEHACTLGWGEPSCAKNSVAVDKRALPARASSADLISRWQNLHSQNDYANTSAPAHARGFQPAITFEQLCAAGLDETGLRCGTGMPAADRDGATAQSARAHVISGRVLSADGLGISGVTVLASPVRLYAGNRDTADAADVPPRYRTVTDPGGFYSFTGLADGDYMVQTKAYGPYPAARISARAGVRYANLVLVQRERLVLHGRVLSSEGGALEGVTVLPIVLGMPSVLTDRDGNYALPMELQADVSSVTLRFQRPGFLEEYLSVAPLSGAGADEPRKDVVMQPVEYWTAVIGSLTSSNGSPLSGKTVTLRPVAEQRIYRATTDAEGKFQFPAVEAPSTYQLTVSAGPDHKDYRQQVRITAAEAELSVIVEPYQFGEVSGTLVNLDGSPIPDFNMVLRNTASATANVELSSDADGNFTVPAPAGELVIASQSAPSIVVRGVYLDPGDELHVPLIVDWGEHEIRGMVVDPYGNPVPASRIVLRWTHQTDGISSRTTRRTAADAQGNFHFSELGPGPHQLEIDAPGFRTASLRHDVSSQGYDLTVRLN